MKSILVVVGMAVLAAVAVTAAQGPQAANEALWEASRTGDTAGITAALAKGADVWLHSHPWSVSLFQKYEKLKTRKPGDPNPFVNPGEIAVFLEQRIGDTEKRIAQVKAKTAKP